MSDVSFDPSRCYSEDFDPILVALGSSRRGLGQRPRTQIISLNGPSMLVPLSVVSLLGPQYLGPWTLTVKVQALITECQSQKAELQSFQH